MAKDDGDVYMVWYKGLVWPRMIAMCTLCCMDRCDQR